jgi:hypothetical protein
MTKLRALMMALPIMAVCAPALAADLTGDYQIRITGGRSAYPIGARGCISLVQTGNVLGFSDSGTATARSKTGDYYALKSVITVAFPNTVLTGVLHDHGLSYGTLTVLSMTDGSVVGANSFTIHKGCKNGGGGLFD